jgi:hypothetical protein
MNEINVKKYLKCALENISNGLKICFMKKVKKFFWQSEKATATSI